MEVAEGEQSSSRDDENPVVVANPLDFVPRSGMIVWCLVPEDRKPPYFPPPGPKQRPAFVQSVYPPKTPGDPVTLVVVPGTTKPPATGNTYVWDFIFDETHRDFDQSGLQTTTRFKTNSIVAVPFTAEYFPECAIDYVKTALGPEIRKPSALMGSAMPIQGIIEKAFDEWSRELRRRKESAARRT